MFFVYPFFFISFVVKKDDVLYNIIYIYNIIVFSKGGEKMTILESIQAAEAKAEELRQEATKNVEALLEETKRRTSELASKMYAEAEEKVQQIAKDCDQKLIDVEREINQKFEQEDQKVAALAEKRMKVAVDFILERIIEV